MNISELIHTEQYKEALSKINEKIEDGNKQFSIYYQKVLVLFYLKDFSASEKLYEQLIKINPNSGDLLYSAALVYKAQNNIFKAIKKLELAFEKGNNQSIYEIINLIFERKGFCDYQNCTDCCCSNVLLKGTDGKYVSNQGSFEQVMSNPYENQGWQKTGKNKKGEWIFACKHLGENNVCKIYQSIPQICKDYPSGILSMKKSCTYYFELKQKLPKFNSVQTLAVILDILDAYKYHNEKEILAKQNLHLYRG